MRIRKDIDDGTQYAACFKHETMRCYSVVIGIQYISFGFNSIIRTGLGILDRSDPVIENRY